MMKIRNTLYKHKQLENKTKTVYMGYHMSKLQNVDKNMILQVQKMELIIIFGRVK